jgi:hypothetical protein
MLWLSLVLALPAYGQQKAPDAVAVSTVIVERKPIEKSLDFVGRVEATDHVEIKARVTGYLEAVHFKEGAQVHVIGYRVEHYSWTGEQSIGEAKCLAESNGGLYVTAKSQEDLVAALERTLDCPMTSQLPRLLASRTN